jgi:hypothetical protein
VEWTQQGISEEGHPTIPREDGSLREFPGNRSLLEKAGSVPGASKVGKVQDGRAVR